jgi:hypothetical protein
MPQWIPAGVGGTNVRGGVLSLARSAPCASFLSQSRWKSTFSIKINENPQSEKMNWSARSVPLLGVEAQNLMQTLYTHTTTKVNCISSPAILENEGT